MCLNLGYCAGHILFGGHTNGDSSVLLPCGYQRVVEVRVLVTLFMFHQGLYPQILSFVLRCLAF